MKTYPRFPRYLPPLLAGLLTACMSVPPVAQEFVSPGTDPVEALATLEQRVHSEPGNQELRAVYLRHRDRLAREYLLAADQARIQGAFDRATQLLHKVREFDPENYRAGMVLASLADDGRRLARLAEAEEKLKHGDVAQAERLARSVLAEAPGNLRAQGLLRDIDEKRIHAQQNEAMSQGALAKKVTLQFRNASLRAVFETLSHAAGLNFVFDRDIRDDVQVTLSVRETEISEVIRLLSLSQQIESKQINANSVMIYPATPAKAHDYQDLVTRSFYLANADAKQVQALLKQLVKTKDIFIDEKLNLVMMKDTPEAVHLAEQMIAALDVAEPEVMLEVEVLEVTRSKLRDIGFDFPTQIGYGVLGGTNGTTLLDGFINFAPQTQDWNAFVANPALVLRLRAEDGDTKTLANPRIRVKNRNTAKIHVGDKVPVFTTTSTANVGVAASVSYLDTGIRLEVEPSVMLDDQVSMKVGLEVSNIVQEVTGPQDSQAYRIGTRNASTTLRLRNGETQVLAGLINDDDRVVENHLPGLGDLPLFGKLFSGTNNSSSKTEIVLLITPHIIRNVVPPVSARSYLPSGTEAVIGGTPLRIGSTGPGELVLRGTPGAGAAVPLAAPPTFVPAIPPSPQQAPVAADLALEAVTVRLVAPEAAQAGTQLTVVADVSGQGRHDGGLLEVEYDAARLEAVGIAGAAPGVGTVLLQAGVLPGSQSLVFRVKPGALGAAAVSVRSVSFAVGTRQIAAPASATATITIRP